MDQDDSNLCVGSLAGIRQLSETNYIQGDAGHDELVACNKWDYDTSQFQNTIIENWDLVCGNKIMSKISSFVFFAGTGVGVFLAGILADKIGRHRTICLIIVLWPHAEGQGPLEPLAQLIRSRVGFGFDLDNVSTSGCPQEEGCC